MQFKDSGSGNYASTCSYLIRPLQCRSREMTSVNEKDAITNHSAPQRTLVTYTFTTRPAVDAQLLIM